MQQLHLLLCGVEGTCDISICDPGGQLVRQQPAVLLMELGDALVLLVLRLLLLLEVVCCCAAKKLDKAGYPLLSVCDGNLGLQTVP